MVREAISASVEGEFSARADAVEAKAFLLVVVVGPVGLAEAFLLVVVVGPVVVAEAFLLVVVWDRWL